jgi:hypothetical protein
MDRQCSYLFEIKFNALCDDIVSSGIGRDDNDKLIC